MIQIPSIEQYQRLEAIVQTLEHEINKLKDQLQVSNQVDKPWYTAKEVKEMFGIGDDRTLRRYEKIGVLKPHRVENKKHYSREEVLSFPLAMEKYKSEQV